MNDDRRFGQRAGIRWAIAWLHKHAGEMNDTRGKLVLNTAAFQMGVEATNLQIVEAPEPSASDGWRTMDSAPRDGFILLFCAEDRSIWLAKWQGGQWYGVDEFGLTRTGMGPDDVTGWKVTHWRPLPPPPVSEPSDEGR